MQPPDQIFISTQFRSLAQAFAARLGPLEILAPFRWQSFASRLDLGVPVGPADSSLERTTLVVGPLAAVLKHAAIETGEFGFVMPEAQLAKPWQRAQQWRDNATLALWRAGWSPMAVDRVQLPTSQSTMEFVIGNARPTPPAERPEH